MALWKPRVSLPLCRPPSLSLGHRQTLRVPWFLQTSLRQEKKVGGEMGCLGWRLGGGKRKGGVGLEGEGLPGVASLPLLRLSLERDAGWGLVSEPGGLGLSCKNQADTQCSHSSQPRNAAGLRTQGRKADSSIYGPQTARRWQLALSGSMENSNVTCLLWLRGALGWSPQKRPFF